MKMTAAVMYEQGLPAPYQDSQPLRIEEVELDGPREGEVLVEVKAAGLCHSDLSQVAGLRKRTLPVVMRHEGIGLNAVMAARTAGASRVIGVDIQPSKFELARDLDCTHTFDAAESGFAEVDRLISGTCHSIN